MEKRDVLYKNGDGGGMGCLVIMVLAVIAMPLVGLYLAFAGESSEHKLLL